MLLDILQCGLESWIYSSTEANNFFYFFYSNQIRRVKNDQNQKMDELHNNIPKTKKIKQIKKNTQQTAVSLK